MTDIRSTISGHNNVYDVKKKANYATKEELEKLDKKELVDTVLRLQSHNNHLRNIITKRKICSESVECSSADEKKKKRCFDFSKYKKRHIFLKFLYLGWDYQGLVVQEDTSETIEEYLLSALTKTCLIQDRQSCNFHRCGRTDKGVSSSAQVVSLDIRSRLTDKDGDNNENELDYCKMLNRLLPDDIRVFSWCPAPDECSSRHNCISRTYRYYFIKGQLNIKAMEEAASFLVGEHDFRNFCKMDVGNGVVQFIRKMHSATISKFSSGYNTKNGEFDVYVLTIASNAFLWHQIRCIMSILFLVGENKETSNVVKELLDVDKNPRKPQYCPAHYLPLVLCDSQFDFETKWIYNREELNIIICQLQKKWAIEQIKASQLLDMIYDIKKLGNIDKLSPFEACGLITGSQPRIYKPLLQRPSCETLESRIKYYIKKQRIEKKEEPQKSNDRSVKNKMAVDD